MAKSPDDSSTSSPTKAETAAAKNAPNEDVEPATPSRTRRVVVAAGRSVMHQVQVGTKLVDGREVPDMVNRVAGPGESIEVSHQDALHLGTHGYLHQAVTPPPTRAASEEPRTTINGDDGSVIRPG
jgi:hypothetical protein